MALTQDQIDILLAAELNKVHRGGKRAPKPIARTHDGWFSLQHKLMDQDDPNLPMKCENPNCIDPRNRDSQMCAKPPGTDKYMCRFCFLDGWLTVSHGQESIPL